MTDAVTMELLRDSADDALARYLRARVRTGDLDAARVEAAGRLGYAPAVIAAGINPVEEVDDVDDHRDDVVIDALCHLEPVELLGWVVNVARRLEIADTSHFSGQCRGVMRVAGEVLNRERGPREARELLQDMLDTWSQCSRTFEVSALAYVARGLGAVAGLLDESRNPGSDPTYEACPVYRWLASPDRLGGWRGRTRREVIVHFMAREAEVAARAGVWRWKPGARRRTEFAAQRAELVALLLPRGD